MIDAGYAWILVHHKAIMAGKKYRSSETSAIIIALKDAGHVTKEMCSLVGTGKVTVKHWVANYQKKLLVQCQQRDKGLDVFEY